MNLKRSAITIAKNREYSGGVFMDPSGKMIVKRTGAIIDRHTIAQRLDTLVDRLERNFNRIHPRFLDECIYNRATLVPIDNPCNGGLGYSYANHLKEHGFSPAFLAEFVSSDANRTRLYGIIRQRIQPLVLAILSLTTHHWRATSFMDLTDTNSTEHLRNIFLDVKGGKIMMTSLNHKSKKVAERSPVALKLITGWTTKLMRMLFTFFIDLKQVTNAIFGDSPFVLYDYTSADVTLKTVPKTIGFAINYRELRQCIVKYFNLARCTEFYEEKQQQEWHSHHLNGHCSGTASDRYLRGFQGLPAQISLPLFTEAERCQLAFQMFLKTPVVNSSLVSESIKEGLPEEEVSESSSESEDEDDNLSISKDMDSTDDAVQTVEVEVISSGEDEDSTDCDSASSSILQGSSGLSVSADYPPQLVKMEQQSPLKKGIPSEYICLDTDEDCEEESVVKSRAPYRNRRRSTRFSNHCSTPSSPTKKVRSGGSRPVTMFGSDVSDESDDDNE